MSSTPPAPTPARVPSYAAVLRAPHARRTFGAGLLGRLSNGVAPLSLLLSVKAATGSYATAGTALAALGLTAVLLSPARAALVDRYSPSRALPPLVLGYATLLAVLAAVSARPGVPGAVLVVLAGAAGMTTPPLGPVTRALWSRTLTDRDLLRRAYSLDTVAEELLFVTGPLLVGLLLLAAAPPAGLALGAALVLTGGLLLSASPLTRSVPGAKAARAAGAVPAGPRPRGVGRAAAGAAALGLCLGAVELLVIAFADTAGRPGLVPWAMAALSAGSAVGGLLFGAVPWRAPAATRLAVLGLALGAVLVVTGLAPHPYLLVAGVALGGLCVAPALTTAYLLADESVAAERRTRAGAWVNTAFNAGSTSATAGAGLLVGRLPLAVCFALAALPPVLTGLSGVLAAVRGGDRSGARAAEEGEGALGGPAEAGVREGRFEDVPGERVAEGAEALDAGEADAPVRVAGR
ncbi:MFS transporter [Streptomyces hydrogenans]|uniref:MFS transporter n=1 Tax=Streptomyces hydrogenans TaxID=1873719 RepID=A0ABQ3PP30_9ACTN|nr:MFS transporter [Streptomyces hydrogenans]GHI26773.1 MFS transporter [Streptomyces hydrogenans]